MRIFLAAAHVVDALWPCTCPGRAEGPCQRMRAKMRPFALVWPMGVHCHPNNACPPSIQHVNGSQHSSYVDHPCSEPCVACTMPCLWTLVLSARNGAGTDATLAICDLEESPPTTHQSPPFITSYESVPRDKQLLLNVVKKYCKVCCHLLCRN